MHTEFEKLIIDALLEGKTQYDMAIEFQQKGVIPCSLSSIEKTLKELRRVHKAKTMFHLGAIITLKRYILKAE